MAGAEEDEGEVKGCPPERFLVGNHDSAPDPRQIADYFFSPAVQLRTTVMEAPRPRWAR